MTELILLNEQTIAASHPPPPRVMSSREPKRGFLPSRPLPSCNYSRRGATPVARSPRCNEPFIRPSEVAKVQLQPIYFPKIVHSCSKFQVLMDHLKVEDAPLIADAYLNSPTP
ncbi:hypothetical protein ILYODFUR_015775 [Ilyodon furcidens]|uniref:Uncharacterized protein n=1 Tax=Ilyodon furcidens TaxID=33524 RepID=A0ABV0VFW3_9TELE